MINNIINEETQLAGMISVYPKLKDCSCYRSALESSYVQYQSICENNGVTSVARQNIVYFMAETFYKDMFKEGL